MLILVEIFKVWYVAATALSALLGAVTNFALGRAWAFGPGDGRVGTQFFKYAVVSAGSLALNTVGVWVMTETLAVSYIVSKVTVSLAIGIFYNFPLHRKFVFR